MSDTIRGYFTDDHEFMVTQDWVIYKRSEIGDGCVQIYEPIRLAEDLEEAHKFCVGDMEARVLKIKRIE